MEAVVVTYGHHGEALDGFDRNPDVYDIIACEPPAFIDLRAFIGGIGEFGCGDAGDLA